VKRKKRKQFKGRELLGEAEKKKSDLPTKEKDNSFLSLNSLDNTHKMLLE